MRRVDGKAVIENLMEVDRPQQRPDDMIMNQSDACLSLPIAEA
jgi:hypothetical protein